MLVMGIVVSLVLLALLFALFRDPVYTAEAAVSLEARERLVSDEEREDFVGQVRGAVVATDGFMQEVMRRAAWEADLRGFREQFDFETEPRGDAAAMLVRFSASEPEQAARAANAYAELFVARAGELNDAQPASDAVLERRAVPPEGSSVRFLLYAAAAVAAGVLAGGAGALLLEGRTRSWRDARDAELTLRAPVLGVIPDYSSVRED